MFTAFSALKLGKTTRGRAALGAAVIALAASAPGFADTVKVAFSQDWTFASPKLATQFFEEAKKQFETEHPGDTMELIPIPGTYTDFITKLSLLFGDPDSKPDIVQYFDINVGQFAGSGLLAPLDDQISKAAWWVDTPQSVKNAAQFDGKVYSAPQGINTYGILFDRTILDKAGLPKDWAPKSWKDILDAARTIKAASPDTWPLYVMTGEPQGTFGVVAGPGMLLEASSTPTIFDTATGKWVVDSKGIREVLDFYKTAAKEGLLAPSSQIMDPNGALHPAQDLPVHKVGITFAGNWIPLFWGKDICSPCWDPAGTVGFAKVPTSQGQAPGTATSFNGVVLSMAAKPANPDLTWAAIDMMQQQVNLEKIAAWVPVVPSPAAMASSETYLKLTPEPFQAAFASVAAEATAMPSQPEFPIWGTAFQQATQKMVLEPDTSIDDAVKILSGYMTNQVGADMVETLP